MDLRSSIVESVGRMVQESLIFWPYDHITIQEWSLKMERRFEHGDHICLQIARYSIIINIHLFSYVLYLYSILYIYLSI